MPDLVFTIKTPAELEGAERAAQALEVSIGKAKGLGKEYAALEARLKTVTDSISAFKAAQTESAAASPAAAETKKAADESERYAKALEAMQNASHNARAEEVQRQIDLQNSMKGTGESLDDAGEKTKLFSGHSKELKKAIAELSREFPLAGLALKTFASPIGATLGVAIGLFVAVKRQIDETNQAMDDMATRNAAPLSNFAEAFRNATNEATASTGLFVDYIKKLGEGVGTITTNADAAVAAIKRVEVAQTELLNAQEAKALAEVNAREAQGKVSTPDAISQRQQIRDFYAKQQRDAKTASEQGELQARLLEIAQKQQRVPTLENAASGDATGRAAKITELKQQAEAARKIVEDTKKDLTEAESKRDSAQDTLANRENSFLFNNDPAAIARARAGRDTAQQRVDDLQTRSSQAKKLAESSEQYIAQLENQKKAQEDAKVALENLTKEVERLKREFSEMFEAASLSRQTREQVGRLQSETRGFETQTEAQKADEKAAREEEQRRKKLGHDADNEITAPSLRAPQAAMEAAGDNAVAAITNLGETFAAKLQQVAQAANDAASKLQDSENV